MSSFFARVIDKGEQTEMTENLGDVLFRMLPGEKLLDLANNVTHLCPYDGPMRGTLYLTNYKLVFQTQVNDKNAVKPVSHWKGNTTLFHYNDEPGPEIALSCICRIEKLGGASNRRENTYGLEIYCNDFRTIRFGFISEVGSRRPLSDILVQVAFPLSYNGELFAYTNRETFDGPNGWEIYDPREEFRRQHMNTQFWRISEANKDYSVCDTYGQLLAVPASVDDATLRSIASFRSRGRIPILSWVHPSNGASLTRCSQPKVGMWRRNEEDERFILSLRKILPSVPKLYIIDARLKANAMANQAKGAGYESTGVYEGTELLFMDIANIHVMRESLRKLQSLCFPFISETTWHAGVEASRWLDHLRLVITAAVKIVDLVDHGGFPCMVHCSDGWDRTAQLTSISSILLDSYYRTFKGFAVVIEKEWTTAGHKFASRIGQGDKNYSDDQRAPIFLQFLDCVHQLLLQFPTAFEFNMTFLIALADEVYNGRFGTFLHNSDKQRQDAKKRSQSVWSFLLSPSKRKLFSNTIYLPTTTVLKPVPSLRRLKVWTALYARWSPQLESDRQSWRPWQLQSVVKSLQSKIQEIDRDGAQLSPNSSLSQFDAESDDEA